MNIKIFVVNKSLYFIIRIVINLFICMVFLRYFINKIKTATFTTAEINKQKSGPDSFLSN